MRESSSAVVIVPDADAMERCGAELAAALSSVPDRARVVHLSGDLGAGKTTLVRGLLRALGVSGAVRSPTYTLIEPYELPAIAVYHLDLYRLADPTELIHTGVRDLLDAESLLLIEWPDRGGREVPPADVLVSIDYVTGREGRRVELGAQTATGVAVLRELGLVNSKE